MRVGTLGSVKVNGPQMSEVRSKAGSFAAVSKICAAMVSGAKSCFWAEDGVACGSKVQSSTQPDQLPLASVWRLPAGAGGSLDTSLNTEAAVLFVPETKVSGTR